MISKLPGELLYQIISYLDTDTLYNFSKLCKYTHYYAKKEIIKRSTFIIENEEIFKEEKDILYWMIHNNYFILHVIEHKEINKKYMDLWFFYLDKKYIEKMYQTNIKIMYQIQKLVDNFIDL